MVLKSHFRKAVYPTYRTGTVFSVHRAFGFRPSISDGLSSRRAVGEQGLLEGKTQFVVHEEMTGVIARKRRLFLATYWQAPL